MNEFIMLNWYNFDLNYKIIMFKRRKQPQEKNDILNRILNDFYLKV